MTLPMIQQLIQRGVAIPEPAAVVIGSDVKPERIAKSATLLPGCRIEGASTSIGPGSVIGSEGPAVVRNCQLGHKVTLASGFFDGSVFLDGASMGGNAHVRPGCLLEEQASGAHAVGIKQTVLMSYVTLGSLINFCDCLMSGGTSRKHHSEVGSSYIHFNFTPHQDKATPSLIGDVVRGVLLNQAPIFLGGQGGLVGPARVAFGTVVAAGSVLRHDIIEANQLVVPPVPAAGQRPYPQEAYGPVHRLIVNNLWYIGSIRALALWYNVVRRPFMSADPFAAACIEGAMSVLALILDERIKRLGELAAKMDASIAALSGLNDDKSRGYRREQEAFRAAWPEMETALKGGPAFDPARLEALVAERPAGVAYLDWIKALRPDQQAEAMVVLDGIVHATVSLWKA
jgi:hypothetical protein